VKGIVEQESDVSLGDAELPGFMPVNVETVRWGAFTESQDAFVNSRNRLDRVGRGACNRPQHGIIITEKIDVEFA
jgi:hypothetical protein